MFYPHLSEITIARDEPNIDPKKELKVIQRRNSLVASKVVTKDLLKNPKASKSSRKKLRDGIEFDERLSTTKKFMELWNKWRSFYFDAKPVRVKNKGQLTCIEKIIELARENEMNLSILIASTHKAFTRRKVMPGFTMTLAYGIEHYEQYANAVVDDIDKSESESQSYE